MRTLVSTLVLVISIGGAVALAPGDDRLPPDHPPITTQPALPPNHPPVATQPALPPGHPPLPVGAADPAFDGAREIVGAYYAAISGGPGEARDWARFESLFRPEARLTTITPDGGGDRLLELTPAQFVGLNRSYFERGGYFETPIHEQVVSFGGIAHVWSTYESRRRRGDAPYARGVNSFQLVSIGGRWWIAGVAWERERAGLPIPAEHLPAP